MSRVVFSAVLLLILPGTFRGQDAPSRIKDFRNLKSCVTAAAAANTVLLLEGLPHQEAEKELLAEELKSKKTIRLHRFPFYDERLDLTNEDSDALQSLLADAKSFQEFQGKFCGGFHPDYAVQFKVGREQWNVLICLGCHEVQFLGPKVVLHCDLTDDAFEQLSKTLERYHKNRPKKE